MKISQYYAENVKLPSPMELNLYTQLTMDVKYPIVKVEKIQQNQITQISQKTTNYTYIS